LPSPSVARTKNHAADAAHQPKKQPRLNENGKAVTDDRERRRDAKEREQQHYEGHRKFSNQASH
jgi:hypothetical protein